MFLNLNLLVIAVVGCINCEEYEELISQEVLKELLNEDFSSEERFTNEIIENEPVLLNGSWWCGTCNNVDETKIIYTENNEVYIGLYEKPIEMQIQIAVGDMSCIEVAGDKMDDLVVHRVSGACRGTQALLRVTPHGESVGKIALVVRVFGK